MKYTIEEDKIIVEFGKDSLQLYLKSEFVEYLEKIRRLQEDAYSESSLRDERNVAEQNTTSETVPGPISGESNTEDKELEQPLPSLKDEVNEKSQWRSSNVEEPQNSEKDELDQMLGELDDDI